MLLTGFDAPIAQVRYLDRLIQQAELLQAIARVNRTADKKLYGLIVDHYGVSAHLSEALAAYTSDDGTIDPDAEGALRPLTAEIERLQPQCERVRQLFVQRGIQPAPTEESVEKCLQLLTDERLRAEFDVALDQFLDTLDTVLPRPQALPFVGDAKLFGAIQVRTRLRYRDTPGDFDPYKYKDKVRALIDEHITVLDLTRKIAPVRITDVNFATHVNSSPSPRATASEMEHAVRHHIREHLDEDPIYYQKLSERLDEIITRLEGRWEQIVIEFNDIVNEVRAGRSDINRTGLDPVTELPFHSLMAERLTSSDPDAAQHLVELTRLLVQQIRSDIAVVGFWQNAIKQDEMRRHVKRVLDESNLFDYGDLDQLAVDLVALAKANQHRLR